MQSSAPATNFVANRIGKYAALQSAVEVSLGSLIHGFKIPLGGHLLSLNQGVLLSFSVRDVFSRREQVQIISGCGVAVALLKSLSPLGKRLTPMLAIVMQSLMFAMGVGVFGVNVVGFGVGFLLLSLWGIVQSAIVAYLMFGKEIFLGIEKVWREICDIVGIDARYGLYALIVLVLIKVALGVLCAVLLSLQKIDETKYVGKINSWVERVQKKLGLPPPAAHLTPAPHRQEISRVEQVQIIIKDLMSPWFLAGLVVSCIFVYATSHAQWTSLIIYALRVLCVSAVTFWCLRFLVGTIQGARGW